MILVKSNLILLCYLLFFSCKSKIRFSFEEINISIQYSSLYGYDLQNENYTVHFLSKLPYKTKFRLTEIEKNEILNAYYLYKIDEIDSVCIFTDNCYIMPKLITSLNIKSGNLTQKIGIDESCDKFSFLIRRMQKR